MRILAQTVEGLDNSPAVLVIDGSGCIELVASALLASGGFDDGQEDTPDVDERADDGKAGRGFGGRSCQARLLGLQVC